MRLTEEQKQEIRELYSKGKHTQIELATLYSVSRNQIRTVLTPKIPQEYDRRVKLLDAQKQEIVKKYNTGRYTYNELAHMYNVSRSTIRFVVHPEYQTKRVNQYNKDKAIKHVASHRAYRKQLIKKGIWDGEKSTTK